MRTFFGAAAMLATACAPAIAGAQFTPDEATLIDVAAAAVRAAPEIARIWPGYWSADEAFVLHPVRGAALYVAPDPPRTADLLPLEDSALPPILDGKVFLYRAALPPGDHFDQNFRVGDRVVTAVGKADTAFTLHDRKLATLTYLFHESFHAHQERRFLPTRGSSRSYAALEEPDLSIRFVDAPEFASSAEVERRMLGAALELSAGDELRSLLKDYLAVRITRIGALPPEYRDGEAHNERKEGSAHLVGFEAGWMAFSGSNREVVAAVRSDLLDARGSGGRFSQRYRGYLYSTGAAIGLLLDRLGVDWRQRMQSGATFVDLLAESVSFDPTADSRRARSSLERFGYSEIISQAPAPGDAYPIADFERIGALRLTLVRFPPRSVRFSGAPITVEDDLTVYPAGTELSFSSFDLALETTSRPVLLDLRAAPRLVVILSAPLTIGGGEIPEGTTRVESGVLRGEGVDLTIDRPFTITREGGSLTISPL